MKRKLKIGIIGAGSIGGALTRHFTRLGLDVVVANSRGPESLAGLAKETGAKPATVAEVPRGRDLVVVTIPQGKIPNLPLGLFKNAPDDLIHPRGVMDRRAPKKQIPAISQFSSDAAVVGES